MNDPWMYLDNGVERGPISADELRALIQAGTLHPTVMVMSTGMKFWVPALKAPGLNIAKPTTRLPDPQPPTIDWLEAHEPEPLIETLPVLPDMGPSETIIELPGQPSTMPTRPEPTMPRPEIGRSLSYMTEEPGWFGKVALGGLLSSFIVLEAAVDGFQIQTIRNIREGRRHVLPSWSEIGELFKLGLPLRLAIWCMYVPAMLVTVFAGMLTFVALVGSLFGSDDTARTLSGAKKFGRYVVVPLLDIGITLLQLLLFFCVPAFARRVAEGFGFVALFDLSTTLRLIWQHLGTYITARLTVFVFLFVVSLVFGVVSGVGWVIIVGPILGWYVFGVGRFWGRMTWAYYLAHMEHPEPTQLAIDPRFRWIIWIGAALFGFVLCLSCVGGVLLFR